MFFINVDAQNAGIKAKSTVTVMIYEKSLRMSAKVSFLMQKSIIFDAKCTISNTEFIILNTKCVRLRRGVQELTRAPL